MTTMLDSFSVDTGKRELLKLCKDVSGSQEIYAACFHGPRVYDHADEESNIDVLLVVREYRPKMAAFTEKTNDACLSIIAVDQQIFEGDVKQGDFGESVAEAIVFPYHSWINGDYLEEMEVRIKRRYALELLRNIVLKYPELSSELLIRPEYFMYEVLRRMTKLFPSLKPGFSSIFRKKVRKRNISLIMRGFNRALAELEKDKYIVISDGYIRMDEKLIETTKNQRKKLTDIMTSVRKAVLPYTRSFFSKVMIGFLRNQRFSIRSSSQDTKWKLPKAIEDAERFLLAPTPLGPIPLSDKTSIEGFVRKTVPSGETFEIEIRKLGGVLNSVFLLDIQKRNKTQKVVVKRFEDWLGFKWLPLALWTVGTQSFAVLGDRRLQREYSVNQFLGRHGFRVPQILYMSIKERMIFEEFVEGEKLNDIIKRLIGSSSENATSLGEIIEDVGKEIAKAHTLGVSFGDCKPENILYTDERRICFLDLEQATRNGNKTWDLAEFLYYSGHYFPPLNSDSAAKVIARSFINGYQAAGGSKETVRLVASAKYTKVFSIFTMPHIILAMANICREMGTDRKR
jgi:tRNA A-37 threonylcarbamoyl transferase component Bud32